MAIWVDVSRLALFIPTFFVVSVTPGLCMTLALSLGMQHGVRRTLPMMAGELLGVALVAVCSVLGVAAVMLNYPQAFTLFKYAGAVYLLWLSVSMWRASAKVRWTQEAGAYQPRALALQGLLTAVSNPKGWAFMVSLLPPFIAPTRPLWTQMSALVALILLIEFACLLLYAAGGQGLRQLLSQPQQVRQLNRVAALLMALVGLWLGLS
ncbi:MAG: LysE family translocator [Aeromonas sp.]